MDIWKKFRIGYTSNMLINIHKHYSKGEFCDVNIKVGPSSFAAHKVVLCAASQYFTAMFTSSMLEAEQKDVHIHQVEEKNFELLLNYIYTGELPVTEETCQNLLSVANMFQLQGAVDICSEFMKQQLDLSNCLGIYQYAESQGCASLAAESLSYIHTHFSDVIHEEEFLDLPVHILIRFLQSELLRIENEYQLFHAAMTWILKNVSERRQHVFDILNHIRIPIILQNHLQDFLDNKCHDLSLQIAVKKYAADFSCDAECWSDFGCDAECLERSQSTMSPYTNHSLNLFHTNPHLFRPRQCALGRLLVVGGYCREEKDIWSECQSLSTVECFNTILDQWKQVPSMNIERMCHGVCAVDGLVYAIGGESDGMIHNSVECFDPVSQMWMDKAPMKSPRCSLGVCVVDKEIYAIGGWVGSIIGWDIEKYIPRDDIWLPVDKLYRPRFAFGVAEYQGSIYLVGGKNELETELSMVERFTPSHRTWKTLASLKTPRAHIAVAVLNDHLYAIGGWNEESGLALNDVEKYCFETNTWTKEPSMKYERAGACAAVVNGLLYVIGGRTKVSASSGYVSYSATVTVKNVECFNPQEGRWTEACSVTSGRCEAGVAVL